MKTPLLLIAACLSLVCLSSCAAPFDQEKVFQQSKTDCYQQDRGLCDGDIQALRDHGDDADANIAAGYETAGEYINGRKN